MTKLRKFIAMNCTELGFNTVQEVKDWIKLQENPDKWRAVEIIVDDFIVEADIAERIADVNNAYNKGVEDERNRIMKNLLSLGYRL